MAAKKKAKRKTLKRKPVKKIRPVTRKPAKKKIIKRRPVKRTVKKVVKKKQEGTIIGKVTHYFPHVNAAVIKLKAPLAVGDTVKIKGHTTDFKQAVTSMQIDRVPINSAKKGDEVGLLVQSRVRGKDIVFKI